MSGWMFLQYDIEKARDGIDNFAGDAGDEMAAFERIAIAARAGVEFAEDILSWFGDDEHDGTHPFACLPCQAVYHATLVLAKARGEEPPMQQVERVR